MKAMKLLGVFVPVLLGVTAALWTPLTLWYDMKEGLIAFLGFLAASLVQVMALTANFLQSDRLSPSEAERLTASLTKQQHYWVGLLSATIASMVIVIVGAALNDRVTNLAPLFQHRLFLEISWSALVCFFIASSVSFVLMKMLGLFEGMLSLHRLRGELVINSAKRDAAEKISVIQKEARVTAPLVPKDYGRIIHPH
jgi:hypothetical protein